MNSTLITPFDPALDLILEREIDVPVEAVWDAWTNPEKLVKWFTPAPWGTKSCKIDLRPGGEFQVTMMSPEGEEFPNSGCYLEILPNERLIWTSALGAGYRPLKPESWPFTAYLLLERTAKGTKYTCIARHASKEDAEAHGQMGFEQGWGSALDQMVAMIKAE